MLTRQMMTAAKDNDARTMAQALASGVPPDAANSFGQTSLHVAALWGNELCAKVLLKAGANVNIANSTGATPLHFAAQKGHINMSLLLIQHGAKEDARAQNGLVPWEMATSIELRALLGGPSNDLHRSIEKRDVAQLQSSLGEGLGDLCERDVRGCTPLHLVVLECVKDGTLPSDGLAMLQALLGAMQAFPDDRKRAFDALDNDGMAPLHVFVKARHMQGTGLLLGAGASPNTASRRPKNQYNTGQWGKTAADGSKEVLTSRNDSTALHLAIECDEPSHELIELLLSHKAGAPPLPLQLSCVSRRID